MAWLNLNQSLNSLKGQITNFATEVLSESNVGESEDTTASSSEGFKKLQEKCEKQENEIITLQKLNEELQAALEREILSKKNGVKEDESSWYWDPPPDRSSHDEVTKYKLQVQQLQDELSAVREKEECRPDGDGDIHKLREENQALSNNLEDLDSQHQLAMDRLLSLKKELQKNFEMLKQEHEELKSANDEYLEQLRLLQIKLDEKDKEIDVLAPVKTELDTLHHKYQNLERIHGLLRENAEKFQEENQDLHEEVFKLQEQVTKLEHDLEISAKNNDLDTTVPKEKYEEILRELMNLKDRRISGPDHFDEINIDDNAKSVIETLKREISELKHKLAKETEVLDATKSIKTDKIMQLYNKYVNFELPVDYVGEIPSTGENVIVYKLESAFKTLHSFKKDIDHLEHSLSERTLHANHLKTEIEDLTAENELMTTDVHHLEKELSEMKKNNDFLISELANIKNSSKLEPISETHEDNIVKLENELEDSNRLNKTFESEIRRIEKELSHVNAEKVLLQESLEDLKEKYTNMINELESCKTQTKAVNEYEHEVINAEHAEILKNAKKEIDELKKLLNASNTKNEKMAIDFHIVENDKVILTKEVDDLTHEIKNKSLECANIKSSMLDLEKNLKDVQVKLEQSHKEQQEIDHSNKALKESIKMLESGDTKNDTTSKILEVENKQILEKVDKLNTENHSLKSDLEKILSELNTHKERERNLLVENETAKCQIANMSAKILELEKNTADLKSNLTEQDTLKNQVNNLKSENKDLITHKLQLEIELTSTNETINKIDENLKNLELQIQEKDLIIDQLNATITQNKDSILTSEKSLEEIKTAKDGKDKEIKELNQTLLELQEKLNANTNSSQDNDEHAKLISEKESMSKKLEALKSTLSLKENEIAEIKNKFVEMEATCEQYKLTFENVTKEKTELINLVGLKHNESIQYHNEIQRLNHVLLEQANEFKRVLEEKSSISENCANCDNLKLTLAERERVIFDLNKNASDREILTVELSKAMETIKVLSEKCENLDKNLAIQLEVVKNLTAENAQLSDASSSATRELSRLRQHLAETEEIHTKELLAAEQRVAETQARLTQMEEKVRQTSTVYTSNSIRANQEVETLRTQLRLSEQSRQDLERRVSETEDARSKSEAAAVNLQLALMQFQSEKDRDIEAATEKIRNKMAELRAQNGGLQQEIQRLNSKLEESLAGLQAATRLGDQLETKTAIINDMKEQVSSLQSSLQACESRAAAAASNTQDRVDKHLVKNLIVNYVVATDRNDNNRTQILRILSSVLDFNQSECERLGLSRSHTTDHPTLSRSHADSLARQFVQFLEQESRPNVVPVGPDMMSSAVERDRKRSQSSIPPSPQLSHSRNASTGSNNILFTAIHSTDLEPQRDNAEHKLSLPTPIGEDTGVNQTRNNEGAILMHVLKDVQ